MKKYLIKLELKGINHGAIDWFKNKYGKCEVWY